MSAFVLANFLQKEAKNNPNLLELLDICAKKIEEREYLQKENAALEAECLHLEMQFFTMEDQVEKMQEIDKDREKELENAKSVLAEIVKTRLQFDELEINELAKHKLESCHLKMKQEYKEYEKDVKEEQSLIEQLENRTIVKQLRAKQTEVVEIKTEMNTMEKTFNLQKERIKTQINHVLDERNAMIVEFVKYVKNIHKMQTELNATEETKEVLRSENENGNSLKNSSCILEKEDYVPTMKCANFLQELLQSKHPNNNSNPMRSILRKETTETSGTKQVLLVTADESSVSSAEDVTEIENFESCVVTQSEDVIEADDQVEENYINPGQNLDAIVDLVTPAMKSPVENMVEKEDEIFVVESSKNKQTVDNEVDFNSSFREMPMTSTNSVECLANYFNTFFRDFGGTENNSEAKVTETAASAFFDDTFNFDNVKDMASSSTANKKTTDSFMDFNLDMEETRQDGDAEDEDFSKFFD